MSYYVIEPTSVDLQHHGILGMKWGVRRYQNADGTLTAAGERRYRRGIRIQRSAGSRNTDTMKEARTKDINKMSNQELKDYNERLRLEREYADLTKGNIYEGKKIAKQIGTAVVTGIATGLLIEAGKTYIKGIDTSSIKAASSAIGMAARTPALKRTGNITARALAGYRNVRVRR